jgi:hypothetical protein
MNYFIDKIIDILDYVIVIDDKYPRLIYFILGFLIGVLSK